MNQLHQHLSENLTWYRKWHEEPHHKVVHYGFFLGVLVLFGAMLASLGNPPTTQAIGNTYYMAANGSDSNPGTINAPFATFAKLNTKLVAGDTAYIRGGTYTSTAGNNADVHFQIGPLTGTDSQPINILAYPGEKPIFDLSNVAPNPGKYVTGMWLYGSSYVNIKGLTIKNLKQDATGAAVNRGFQIVQSNHCKVELLDIYNIGGTGFGVDHSNDNLFLNNDSHNNGDGMSPDRWNFGDGFTIGTGGDTSNNNVFEGNRAWMNGDDGWDAFEWSGQKVTYKNNWSFWNSVKPWGINGTQPSDAAMTPYTPSLWKNTQTGAFTNTNYLTSTQSGEGFKLGGCNYGQPQAQCPPAAPTTTKKFLENNVSFGNVGTGYAANMDATYSHRMSIINSIAFNNGNDGIGFGTGRSVGIAMIFKNDWAWNNNQLQSGADIVYDGITGSNISNNYWGSWYNGGSGYSNPGNLNAAYGGTIPQLTMADFLSVDESLGVAPRQADGSLPNVNFLKLATTSGLIDKGIPVNDANGIQIPYGGTKPDLGAYEIGTVITPQQDLIAPTISLTSPTNGAFISGTIPVTLAANAADNVGGSGVDHVDFYRTQGATSVLIGADATSPYTFAWDSSTVANGAYTLTGKAYDVAGNSTASTGVSVTVSNVVTPPTDTTAPTVSLTAPAAGATLSGTSATISASATDNVAVTKVEFYRGSTLIDTDTTASGSAYSVSWNTTAVSNGTYDITAKAYDAAGNTKTSSVATITVANTAGDTSAPTVSITSAGGYYAKLKRLTLKASASDNTAVTKVEFMVNDVIKCTDNTTPYTCNWSVPFAAGSYVITARAYDAAGNSTLSQSVKITNVKVTDLGTVVDTISLAPLTLNGVTSGTISGSVAVEVASVTSANQIARVDFYQGSTLIGSDNTYAPYTIAGGWNTASLPNGTYSFTAIAYDTAGNSATSAPTTVTISN